MLSERLLHAINEHDLDAFVACFDAVTAANSLFIRPARFVGLSKSGRTGRRSSGRSRSSRRAAGEATEWGEWGGSTWREVEEAGQDIDQAVQRLAGTGGSGGQ